MNQNQPERDRSEDQIVLVPAYGASGLREYVPVVFAADLNFAEEIKTVLTQSGIPTLLEGEDLELEVPGREPRRTAVLVPEEWHEEATELVLQLEQEVCAGLDEEDEEDDFDDEDEYFDDEDELDDDFDDEDDDEDLFEDDDADL